MPKVFLRKRECRSLGRRPPQGGAKMTAEIAVLNKFGVALAADSAITVDTFHEGEIKTKVYNTANKLFSLSKYHPVGIMFYNTVTLGGIPWETVIKCYRKKLGRQSFGTVDEYARDIFSWLNSSPAIFDEEMGSQHNPKEFVS